MKNPLTRYVKSPLTEEVTDWDAVDETRFARVTVTDSHLLGWNHHGQVVQRIPLTKCVGETYDWDTQQVIACPDHPAAFCPGERNVA